MRNIFRILVISLFSLVLTQSGFAEQDKFGGLKGSENIKGTASGCSAPAGYKFLNINNVRARINTGGDMWWDLGAGIGAQYYIPANSSTTSMFSGSLWIGGLDINNQLKLAALRYRQVGQDYWTGPLTIDGTAAIDKETCSQWDKMFDIKRADIDQFLSWWNSDNKAEDFPGYTIPESILNYPAHGDVSKGQSYYLAPFKDVNGDGDYDPNDGDYPYYDITNELCPLLYANDPDYVPTPTMETELYYPQYFGGILVDQVLKGDETLWWIFNDKGNFHSESKGASIGMEIRAQAFGFSTNDAINNMTFYSYEIINRSTYELTQTYFAPWVDTDLGYAWDDYVGCDVGRGLGYCYNGKAIDGGGEPEAYGEQPPAIGVDFFQGPYMDADDCDNPSFVKTSDLGPSFEGDCSIVSFDGVEIQMSYGPDDNPQTGLFTVRAEAINGVNFGNGIKDDERYGMKRFVYHNNANGVQGGPNVAPEYYNYLRGFWKDNSRMQYGGNGHVNSGALGPDCDFMFPYDSDPCNWGTGGIPPNGGFNQNGLYWSEEEVGNNPSDRRFMQSAGPFTLKPGAVNYITVGIPWARAIAGGPWASVKALRDADDKCQALFDNCFKVIDGPSAPDLTFEELNNEIVIYISNSKTSNNYKEGYKELDPLIKAQTPDSLIGTPLEYDAYYRFEGYEIYQLKDASVSLAESKHDISKARLVAQFDIKNGVTQLVNYYYDPAIQGNVPVVEVVGGDNGISHSITITEDAFTQKALVNHKQYYYSAIAYAYNNFKDYDQTIPTGLDGQKKPYLSGRKNIQLYTAIPHPTINGLVVNSDFGDGPEITRIEGQGNGGMLLEFSDKTIEEILSKQPFDPVTNPYGSENYPIAYHPLYTEGHGPVNIKVIDPLKVKSGNFTIKFDTIFNWYTYQKVSGEPIIFPGGDTAGLLYTPKWWLINNDNNEIYEGDTSTNINYEQLFLDLGLSISFGPQFEPGPYSIGIKPNDPSPTTIYKVMSDNNGLLGASVIYADSSRQWLSGVKDIDVPADPRNWIRAGTYKSDDGVSGDWSMPSNPWDPNEVYEKIAQGTWAPYGLCATDKQSPAGPAYDLSKSQTGGLSYLNSVDIVITPDKSKWTRCPVIEMSPDEALSEGHVSKFSLRFSPSLDKEGNAYDNWPADTVVSDNPADPNYIYPYGMSWFPGYAINIETGERLNIMFGENSWLSGENGRDMLFNPSPNELSVPGGEPLFGGQHYVYIMGHTSYDVAGQLHLDFPAYDAGKTLVNILDTIPENMQTLYRTYLYGSAMYVGMPLSVKGKEWLSNEVKIKIRIAKPYARYYSVPDTALPEGENKHYPLWTFSTNSIAATEYSRDKAVSDLNKINVVPNPYYAYSGYERVPLDNRVKITNLPEKCVVTIFTVNGTKIRQFTKDDPFTSIDWDLKNTAGIPIAGGIYIIHIKDETTGDERIIKWFGSLRVEDFKQF